ncbi:MAG TPA: tRNA pseudouridine(38-40) synthase TruA [Thermoplasmata archaeon]|nr:tRNA pseudouridine(38-40) synthase TruA [Thermoplasmata archaeon]
MRYALKVAYDGKVFHGFARQPNLVTVEGEIIRILQDHNIITVPQDAMFRSASRTDKGVSALGNVVAFNTFRRIELNNLHDLNNSSSNIYFYGTKEVNNIFYPRHAKMRWYRYYLKVNADMDKDVFLKAAVVFTGTHDFSNFARVETHRSPVRKIENIVVEWVKDDFVVIDFYAQNFLWQQVRRIVAAMKKVGEGLVDVRTLNYTLTHPGKRFDFGVAPAESLILMDVFYDFEFEYQKDASHRLKTLEKKIVQPN